MKTLVIHPKDESTDFLKEIYADKDWTVINDNKVPRSFLFESIKKHDRIIMLGHGTEQGLFGLADYIITSKLVFLLREKICVCIWCNADVFVKKYELKGFYTGMIVSELDEALMYCLYPIQSQQIHESNKLFASAIKNHIDKEDIKTPVLLEYELANNPVVDFNKQNIYQNRY